MNKEDNCEMNLQKESLTDLPLTGEQAQQAKGGAGDDMPTEEVSFYYNKIITVERR